MKKKNKYIAAFVLWWVIGVYGFAYWWVTKNDFTIALAPFAALVGVEGPITWVEGGFIEGGWTLPNPVLIHAKGSR